MLKHGFLLYGNKQISHWQKCVDYNGMKLQLLLYQPKRANAKPLPSKAILTSKKSQYTMSYIPQVSKQAGQATDVGWRVLHGVLGDFLLGRQKHSACSHHSPYT